uniref:hypothetical protein n=1 Tax=Rheinheimera sp. TaxID=1869214 RepID=UPI004048401E
YPRRKNYKKTTTNKPVAKAINKYKRANGTKPTVQKVANNRNAIMTLSRQVKSLQLAKLGEFQKRAEQVRWFASDDAGAFPWETLKPFAFCLNQFNGRDPTTGTNVKAPIYYTDSNGYGQVMRRFDTWVPSALVGIHRDLNPHIADIDDVVSPEVYKPLGTSVKIQIEFNNYPANERTDWFRIDVVRPKKRLLQSTFHSLNMPHGLGQFTALTKSNMVDRNFINPTYWDIVYTKWVPLVNNSGVAKHITKIVTINRSYKNAKPIRTDLNSTSMTKLGVTTYPQFHEQTDPTQLEWCIISAGSSDIQPRSMSILRQISWRDQNGTSA